MHLKKIFFQFAHLRFKTIYSTTSNYWKYWQKYLIGEIFNNVLIFKGKISKMSSKEQCILFTLPAWEQPWHKNEYIIKGGFILLICPDFSYFSSLNTALDLLLFYLFLIVWIPNCVCWKDVFFSKISEVILIFYLHIIWLNYFELKLWESTLRSQKNFWISCISQINLQIYLL